MVLYQFWRDTQSQFVQIVVSVIFFDLIVLPDFLIDCLLVFSYSAHSLEIARVVGAMPGAQIAPETLRRVIRACDANSFQEKLRTHHIEQLW